MTLHFCGRLAVLGCLLVLSAGCNDGSADGMGGVSGAAGMGGAGGATPEPPHEIPGLWEGHSNSLAVCFFIRDDGLRLSPSPMCNLTAEVEPDAAPHSFDLIAELVGTDEQGAPCSFELRFANDVIIDQATHSFRASEIQGRAELAFSGEITGDYASGVALRDSVGSSCRVGWAASKSSRCDEAAIQSCLDLQDCCRAILVNPVFFESCNSVVLQCDQAQCLQVLAGYPQCAPAP